MAFSGALTLTDLNDFITPSQACIKPVEQTNKPVQQEKDAGAAATEIHIDGSGTYYEVAQDGGDVTGRKLEQAQISLNDCLACSGCITSAESVLITLQSHVEVLSVLSNPSDERIPIISIAPQSLASLAAAYSQHNPSELLTPREIFRRIRTFCTSILGFAYVFDTNFARHISLNEHVKEFIERREQHLAKGDDDGSPRSPSETLPMLASACPGWICYAEKAHPEMLPFIARTKSPQQVMGTLVKKWIGKRLGKQPNEIYHVSVMPCYDKKLEASRQDFFDDIFQTRDVDCVVTTGELELMMKEFGWDLKTSSQSPSDLTTSRSIPLKDLTSARRHPGIDLPELVTHSGTSSGSYLHSILRHLTETSPVPLMLSVKTVRNSDYEEYVLRESAPSLSGDAVGKVIFKGAKCYGFRNLQNVVRKVGRERGVRVGSGAAGRLGAPGGAGKGVRRLRAARKGQGGEGGAPGGDGERKYDYVEVMACPGGCVNGGGQLKPPDGTSLDAEGYQRDWDGEGAIPSASAKWGDKGWTKKVEEAYWRDTGRVDAERSADQVADGIVEELWEAYGDSEKKGLFRTEYRAVESDVVGLAVKW
ncbi:hypothetical protein AGABI2DRAFT_185390 [Agaricus bisporus var. bisporus H97]|uniref:hypothetical protein n=1 Tax=Agaricus bisporus var. bisporus (strain H97 / ATCC MYA-4626 / FGSC 10389) TaxID=936046 RepID=UPI00029F6CF0|nr:hypothetical protein AGABI2DRAFT_185390 [Agaricus bisporus var. bisporus H97]EKV47448.1 hypothetical protein AGABI2DRAFT_185390 [Agaricus bisporus var. bisporus H97]